MKRVVLAWELGGGLGHIASFLPLVNALQSASYEPTLILRDISQMQRLYANTKVQYLQAPLWQAMPAQKRQHHNFTDTLFHFGYLEPTAIHAMVQGWVNQLVVLQPQLLILDYAPTALIAARIRMICQL